jgi:hypothetical protein
MNKLFTLLLPALIIAILITGSSIQSDEPVVRNDHDLYSLVKVIINSRDDVKRLADNDITVEHYTGHFSEGIEIVINQSELARLMTSGLNFEIRIQDLDNYYAQREAPSIEELLPSKMIAQKDGVDGFSYGSMGGYYTYDEVVQKLDSMRLRFPNIITAKQNIGASVENRTIWAVKISDNPEANESSTEAPIYFDALHHAREPQAMASVMYFMYWILENYGTDPEATYLVNNREIFFVPVVNPDGYRYNQTTNPNGGGSWRKNRRNNGSSCYGIDLNRNYTYGWGVNSGSSNDPCSETYRGLSAGSEPETQAVTAFVNQIRPKIGLSFHSVAGRYLNPYGYNDSSISYDIYSEFSSDFAASNNYTYGTVNEMLAYYSSGTTRDYLHSIGGYFWTPEVGGGSFWPTQSQIIPVASENLYGIKYLCWVGGAFADMHNWKIPGDGFVTKNDTLLLQVTLKNRGLSKTAKNVTAELTTSYPNATALVATVNFDSIQARQLKTNSSNYFAFRISNTAAYMDEMKYILTTRQEGIVTSIDTILINVGKAVNLFSDGAENGTSRWIKSGTGTQWDTTFIDPVEGSKNFSDSRYGNAKDNSNNYFTLSDTINLAGAVNPRIEFTAKWAMEATFDYIRVQVSTNNGTSWTNLTGRFTKTVSGQPSYTDIKHWKREQMNLNPYIGQRIRIRFNFITDNGVPGDGFYMDNFRVVDYVDTPTGITQVSSEIPQQFRLEQNYPNPFNPSTSISYSLPEPGNVSMKIFDAAGIEQMTLVNSFQPAGTYSVKWNASGFASGIYYCRISYAGKSETMKMIMVK